MWKFIKSIFTWSSDTKDPVKILQEELMSQLANEIKGMKSLPDLSSIKPSVISTESVPSVYIKESNNQTSLVDTKGMPEGGYFKASEFKSPKDKDSDGIMDNDFLNMLNAARHIAGNPWKVTSGKRSPAYNKEVGGVAKSSHELGKAADISATSGAKKLEIVSAAIKAGFTRIGVAKNFIHLDNDSSKPNSIWLY